VFTDLGRWPICGPAIEANIPSSARPMAADVGVRGALGAGECDGYRQSGLPPLHMAPASTSSCALTRGLFHRGDPSQLDGAVFHCFVLSWVFVSDELN